MAILNLDLVKKLGLEKQATAMDVRRKNKSYALNENGDLIGVSFSESDLEELKIDEDARHLKHLYLAHNENLRSIEFKTVLPELEHLYLNDCALTKLSLPDGLTALQQIYVQNNQLTTLEFEEDCPALLLLDASGNQLSDFTLSHPFSTLAYLYLNDNQLKMIQLPNELPSIDTLNLRNNRLKKTPSHLFFADTLYNLYLSGNSPKDIPKTIIGDEANFNCLDRVRIWFDMLKDPSNTVKNDYVKLMLLGNGDAGKSSLLYALKHGSCKNGTVSTDGVDIGSFQLKEVNFNYWDFGGQEIYHGTHRLFMSSEAIQLIVFSPKTEQLAREKIQIKDRITNDQVWNHPIEYWYETSKELSPDSFFFLIQNKMDEDSTEDEHVFKYALTHKIKPLLLSAQTGENIDDLDHFLNKAAKEMPEYDMSMPKSWMQVRQFFIDNEAKAENSTKFISKKEFEERCSKEEVPEISRDLLFDYLRHNGFLYYHPNLGDDRIVVDQRWALEAIYKPLARKEEHYDELRDDLKGKIRVRRLFQIFGNKYTTDEKWLFLDFMKSCGLCFQLNNHPGYNERSENDVYVFPEFLPSEKPQSVVNDWASKPSNVNVLKFQFPNWISYTPMLNFITALGRKTETDNIWRNGINVSTPEGWFKVELDYAQSALFLNIEYSAMGKWLEPILEELNVKHENSGWKISTDGGLNYEWFDLQDWKQKAQERLTVDRKATLETHSAEKIIDGLKDQPQIYVGKETILFVAANPAPSEKLGSQEKEYSKIVRATRKKIEVYDLFTASAVEMNDEISVLRPNILHFCGHASEEGIEMHDPAKRTSSTLDIESLNFLFASLKEDIPELRIVFFNACLTSHAAEAVSKNDIFAIGTTRDIHSIYAISFADGFYKSYTNSKDVQLAINHGLRQVVAEYKEDISSLISLYHNGNQINIKH